MKTIDPYLLEAKLVSAQSRLEEMRRTLKSALAALDSRRAPPGPPSPELLSHRRELNRLCKCVRHETDAVCSLLDWQISVLPSPAPADSVTTTTPLKK